MNAAVSHAVNRVYRILKWDTAKLRGRLLTTPMRQGLYRTVSDVVTTALAEGRPGDLSVRLPYGIVPGGWELPRSLVYRLVKERAPATPATQQCPPDIDGTRNNATHGGVEPVTGDVAG
jgi:hypothetical protein